MRAHNTKTTFRETASKLPYYVTANVYMHDIFRHKFCPNWYFCKYLFAMDLIFDGIHSEV